MTSVDLYHALGEVNVGAFLKALRLGEGTSDDKGYQRLVGGGNFYDFSHHPNVRVWIPEYKVYSTAAGAYQIIHPTWEGLVSQYSFGDFSPACQDLAAVALIAEKGALPLLTAGFFYRTIALCSAVWASLPGSTAGQRTESFDAIRGVYLINGGIINDQPSGDNPPPPSDSSDDTSGA